MIVPLPGPRAMPESSAAASCRSPDQDFEIVEPGPLAREISYPSRSASTSIHGGTWSQTISSSENAPCCTNGRSTCLLLTSGRFPWISRMEM